MDARGWALLVVGAAVGACLALVSGAVRDAVLDAVDVLAGWWWDLVDAVRRFVVQVGTLLLVGLSLWAVVALVLPRLAEK